jgi:biotin synthase
VTLTFERKQIARCCLQVTASPGYLAQTHALARQLHSRSAVPLCASVIAPDVDRVRALLQCGVERVSLALDAACERVYCEAKGGSWQHQVDLLRRAARLYPGRLGTHLIAGLGETEEEMSGAMQEMADLGVIVGLFSFTPIRGTPWSKRAPPALPSYRRIQVARYLLATDSSRIQYWRFSPGGQIVSYGLSKSRLSNLLAGGRAFETAGCPGCNRPYYNERPGKVPYNYPRPLRTEETEAAISLTLAQLQDE